MTSLTPQARAINAFSKKLCRSSSHTVYQNEIIKTALQCLEQRLTYSDVRISNSTDTKAYLRLQLAEEENEVFGVFFLNSQHCLIGFEKLTQGSINRAIVYPRQVVQRAITLNAAAVILTHNHPSGSVKPSQADIEVTQQLQKILAIIDVNVLDHVIVSSNAIYSFAENGEL